MTVGPVLDSSGAAVTTAVVGDFKIAKNGGAPAALNASATLTHRNTGHYSLALTASDTDTVGQAEVVIDATTNACPVKEISVVEEAVYDALFAASAAGYQVPIWSSASATVSLTGTTVATVTTLTGHTPQTGDSYARIGATGSGLTSLAPASTALSTATWTGTRAGYLDNLSGGAVALASGVNVTQISGDSVAADNLEAALDGTGGVTITAALTGNITGNLSGSVGSVSGNVGGNVTGSVGSVATGGIASTSFASGAITAAAIAADAIGASELAADAVAEIADAVWDEVLSGHLTGGTTGNALNAAGSAGDPWSTSLPGAYTAGSAGYILGTNLDATVSSRGTSTLTQTQVTGGAYALNSASFAFNAALPLTTQQKADVNAEADTALSDYDPPTNTEMVAAFTEIKGATWATTDTLEAIRDRGDAAWTTATGFSTLSQADVRTAVGLASANLDTQIGTLATAASLSTVAGNVTSILADTGTDGVVVASGSKTGYALTSAYDFAKGTTVATEAYAANGAAATPVELLYAIHQMLMSFSIAGTAYTVKKLDNSTTAFVVTLDSTTPTGAQRS